MNSVTVTFSGCKHLNYEDHFTARKQLLSGDRVFWMRDVLYEDDPRMVQFCKKRGRINDPERCFTADKTCCSDFSPVQHRVVVPDPQDVIE